MSGDVNAAIALAVRHSCWANLKLIDFCRGLSPEQLAWAVPGTYGSIERTLRHIVGADQWYVFALTGEIPGAPEADPDMQLSLEELAAKVRAVRDSWEKLLSEPFDVARRVTRPSRTSTAGIFFAQLVHHGSDHRAHIGTILGAHGVEPPDLSVWAYGTELGAVTWPNTQLTREAAPTS